MKKRFTLTLLTFVYLCSHNALIANAPTCTLNPEDRNLYSFLAQREAIAANGPGLANLTTAKRLLEGEKYFPLLRVVWSEKNPEKRLSFLKGAADQSHTLMILEYALEYFRQNPDAQSFEEVVSPYLMYGTLRFMQDLSTWEWKDTKDFYEAIDFLAHYQREFEKINPEIHLSDFVFAHNLFLKEKADLILEKKLSLPSSEWVKFANFSNVTEMKDSEECEQIKGFIWRHMVDQINQNSTIATIAYNDEGILTLTDANFDQVIANHTVVVKFYADWCGACKSFNPTFSELAENNKTSVLFAKVNGDQNPKLMKRFSISGYPTLILFKNGKEEGRLVGVYPRNKVESFIAQ